MLKEERQRVIADLVNKRGIITAVEIIERLDVSDMTVRRDLDELEKDGKLKRIHGGAQSNDFKIAKELSHQEKQEIHIEEKKAAARNAATLIDDNDTIFLGPGTTIELISDYIKAEYLKVVTNSLTVFEKFQQKDNDYELYLIGGSYRKRTGAFIGTIANEMIERLKVNKSFIGVNGIHENLLFNANIEEGKSQKIALDNASCKIIVADHHKLDKEDFFSFYDLRDIDYFVTDEGIQTDSIRQYEKYTTIITKKGVN